MGSSEDETTVALEMTTIRQAVTCLELLRRPEVAYQDLLRLPSVAADATSIEVQQQIEIQQKYSGYIERQQTELSACAAMKRLYYQWT